MPNGGGDCCGTCPFNERNKGEAGHEHAWDPGRDYCVIRGIEITGAPFYTYCVNHPQHNPDGISVPVGSVYEGDPYGQRWVSVEAEDTPAARRRAIAFVERMPLRGIAVHPRRSGFTTEIIRQLGRWREPEALPALRRVAESSPAPAPEGYDSEVAPRGFTRSPEQVQAIAREAIEAIEAIEHEGPFVD